MNKCLRFDEYFPSEKSENGKFTLPVGVNERDELEEFTPSDGDRHHILVTGRAGSGKSVYLHGVIQSLLLRYTDQEINLWLCDYTGCEFTKLHAPHITTRWAGCNNNEQVEFLEALEQEFDNRLDLLRHSGARCYEDLPDGKPPRLVVIIDSFGALSYTINQGEHRFYARFSRLVQQVHAVGITLVVAAQTAPIDECRWLVDMSVHIATPQPDRSLMAQFQNPWVVETCRNMHLGDAITDLGGHLHKVTILYVA